jgi:hypothetical protein
VQARRADSLLAGRGFPAEIHRPVRSAWNAVLHRDGLAAPGERIAHTGRAPVAGAFVIPTASVGDDRACRQVAGKRPGGNRNLRVATVPGWVANENHTAVAAPRRICREDPGAGGADPEHCRPYEPSPVCTRCERTREVVK